MGAIRELLVEFGVKVDTSELNETAKEVKSLSGKVKEFVGNVAVLAGAAALGAFIKQTTDAAAEAGDLADQVGLASGRFQELALFAQMGGASVEDLRITLKSLSKNAQSAISDAKGLTGEIEGMGKVTLSETNTMAKAFKNLGVDVLNDQNQLKGSDELLLDVGAALAAIENPTERVAKAQSVLGEASLKLLPALNGTREELQANLDALKDMGGFSEEAIQASRDMQAAQLKMGFMWERMTGTIVTLLAPAVTMFVNGLMATVKWVKELFKQTKFLRNLFGTGLFSAFKLMLPILKKFGQLLIINPGAVFKAALPFLKRFGSLLAIAGRFMRKFILPFLLFDEIFTFLEGGDTLIGRLIDALVGPGTAKKFQDAVGEFGKGIMSFVSWLFADDPEAKAAAWKSMDEAFARAGEKAKEFFGDVGFAIITWLMETSALFGEFFSLIWEDFSTWALEALDKVGAWLMEGAKEWGTAIYDSIVSGFSDAVEWAKKKWEGAKSFFSNPFGGDEAPTVRSAGGRGGRGGNVSQTNNVTQHIAPPPGASPRVVAGHAQRGMQRGANTGLRTMRGLTQG